MRLPRSISLLLALHAVVCAGALAQETGGYAGAYLSRALLAQDVALGGAYSPFPASASAIFNNSADLARLQHPAFLVSTSFLPHDQSVYLIGFGMKLGNAAGLSFGMLSYGIDDVEAYTADEQRIGTASSRDMAFSVGGGLAIGPGNIGATFRYLTFSTLVEGNAAQTEATTGGYSVDLSGTMEFETNLIRRDWLFFSVALNNIAGEMRAGHDRIPLNTRLGASYLFPLEEDATTFRPDPSGLPATQRLKPRAYVLGAFETRLAEFQDSPTYSFAVETVPLANVPLGLRAGTNSLGDVSGGFFLAVPWEFARNLRIDLASRRDYELGDITHHITLTGGF